MSNEFTATAKNIVLFSDGTGNSASKAAKTNVWRTYQALDLNTVGADGRIQVAYYRDGVGTETFKPLALVGGAFGFGVMRDVRELYVFLCRNYKPGDTIYAFGFSRGAFTIRLLVGLVAKCGLVQANDENQLFHRARAAYKAFRRDFLIKASERRKMVYNLVLSPPRYVDGTRTQIDQQVDVLRPAIEFLGLWDTVDAYGMPVDELKQGIDEWIWPMSFADRCLSSIVKHACHALSLDDERPTFRPLLWDESNPVDAARIEQVWFAGVHANVGGGYPIDDLAFVPLVWMLGKASAAGLRFFPDQVRYFEEMRNVHGSAYDSRSGIAGYYRYGPRSLEKLCDDKRHGVHVQPPVVHDSVWERIAKRHRPYAPLSLPRSLLAPGGATVAQNSGYVDLAWDGVFWRRITYFVTLTLTFAFLLSPLVLAKGEDPLPSILSYLPARVAGIAAKLLGVIPAWAGPWVDAFEGHPIIEAPLIGLLVWLFFFQSGRLQRAINERSEWAWAALKGNQAVAPAPAPRGLDAFVRKLRMSPAANKLGLLYDQKIIPNLVGVVLLLWIAWTLVSLARWAIALLVGSG